MILLRSLLVSFVLASPGVAQVFVVDIANGPGADFTSIDAAVAAVPDDAVLQVRAGTYPAFAIRAKSLSVLCDPGVSVSSLFQQPVVVERLAAHQRVGIRGLSWSNALGPGGMLCQDCAGSVVLDGCRADGTTSSSGGYVRAVRCDALLLRASELQALSSGFAALDLEATDAEVSGGSLGGGSAAFVARGGSRLQITGAALRGPGFGLAVAHLDRSDCVVHGATLFEGAVAGWPAALAVDGTGRVVVDPDTQYRNVSPPLFGAGLVISMRSVPRLEASTGSAGGQAQATLAVPVGGFGALLVGMPTAPQIVSGLLDPVWLAPGAVLVSMGPAPQVRGGYAVPPGSAVLGYPVGWQGAVIDAAGQLAVSNPVAYLHH